MSYLYVISEEKNPTICKIGFSKNPEKRIKTFQTGHPEKLKLYYYELFTETSIRKFESIVHKNLKHYKFNNEWFQISPDDAIAEIQFLKIRYENEKYL